MDTDISRRTHFSHLYFYTDNISLLILTLAEWFLTLCLKAGHIPPRCDTNPILQSFQMWDRAQLKTAVHTLHKHCHVVSCPTVDRTLAGRKKPHLRFSQWEWIAKQHPWHKSDGNFAGEMVAHYRYNHWSQLAMFLWMLCLAAALEKLSPAPSPHELSFGGWWAPTVGFPSLCSPIWHSLLWLTGAARSGVFLLFICPLDVHYFSTHLFSIRFRFCSDCEFDMGLTTCWADGTAWKMIVSHLYLFTGELIH